MDKSDRLDIEKSKTSISLLLEYLSQQVVNADADAENISYYFDYNDFDLFNAFMVFNHVWSTYAIHSGALTEENAVEDMGKLRKVIKETYGIDTVELSKTVVSKLDGTDTEKNCSEE